MLNLKETLQGVDSVAILGHIRPDGDCIGSCLALHNYMETYFPQIEVKVYLQEFMPHFLMLKNADKIVHDYTEDCRYDLCFSLDSADRERHGEFVRYFDTAKKTVGIDHHISNKGFAQEHLIIPDASATAEIICELIGKEYFTKEIAECLYLGIAHDTGVFQYSNTSPKTLRLTADLLETGIDANKIIDHTFYEKSYDQNRILGKTLMESQRFSEERIIVGVVSRQDMEDYGVTSKELDGIVSQLRYTVGVEVAVFLYELAEECFKVSLRSNGKINVSLVAQSFGGGGHIKAAGAELKGKVQEVIQLVCEKIEEQM